MNICFPLFLFFVVLFECISFLTILFVLIILVLPFPYFLLLHTFLSFQKPLFSEQFPILLSLFSFAREKETVFSPTSCFLHFIMKKFFRSKCVLTHFETSAWFFFLKKKKLFTFTINNATRSLFGRLLCLLILSFCSSSIHLFSFWGLSVFSRFFHLFFAL